MSEKISLDSSVYEDIFQHRSTVVCYDKSILVDDLYVFSLGPKEPYKFSVGFKECYGIGLCFTNRSHTHICVVEKMDATPLCAGSHFTFYICECFHGYG